MSIPGEYEVVEDIGEWDYAWQVGALLRFPNGALFYAVTSGCSCNDFSDNVEISDLQPVASWHEAVELAKESFEPKQVVEFAARLMRQS